MRTYLGAIMIPALLVLGATAMCLVRLGDAPAYVGRDELVYALNAQSLVDSGRDLSGRFMPMYIAYPSRFGRPTFVPPMLTYAIAVTLSVLPLSETTIRLPMAIVGVVDVMLMYLIGRRLFSRQIFAAAAALLLALTPTHFMFSRLAIDFQMSLPFTLGWMLCVLEYLRRGRPHILLVAGLLLAVGSQSYMAAPLLMPIYGVATCAVLVRRREPLNRYLMVALGFALPLLLAVAWVLKDPLPFQALFGHYFVLDPSTSYQPGVSGAVKAFAASRLGETVSIYASFWSPRFLFIDGPLRSRSTLPIGVFLLPLAGLLIVGVIRAARRRSSADLLVLVGFLTAPLPASLAGEGQAIWRSLALLPFGVLLAISGLEQLREANTTLERRLIFVAMFGIVIGLGMWYHDNLLHAQAWVRASSVPLALVACAMLLRPLRIDDFTCGQWLVVGAVGAIPIPVVYTLLPGVVPISAIVLAAVGVATILGWVMPLLLAHRRQISALVLAVVASELICLHVDFPAQRIGPLPASVVLLTARCAASLALFLAAIGLARWLRSRLSALRVGQPPPVGTFIALAAVQCVYFSIDSFTRLPARLVQVSVVFLAASLLALSVSRWARTRAGLGRLSAVALTTLAIIQGGYFGVDYFTSYRVTGSGEAEGNVRVVWEAVIARAQIRPLPAIFISEPRGVDDAYWQFYLIKHHRQDLLTRTVFDRTGQDARERMLDLPIGSIVVARPSGTAAQSIDRMVSAGELKRIELARALDGTPVMWILERSTNRLALFPPPAYSMSPGLSAPGSRCTLRSSIPGICS